VTVLRSPSIGESVGGCTLTRSAISISPRGLSRLAPGDCVAGAGKASAAPQSPQNLEAGVFSAPHFGQRLASPLPHWEQNFLPTALSVPHFVQRIALPG